VVEAMLGTFVPRDGKVLVLANGAYGQRMAKICEVAGRRFALLEAPEDTPVDPGTPAETSVAGLPLPSVHPNAPAKGGDFALSNGAALYPDSRIPWEIEAAAREAMEDSLASRSGE